MTNDWVLEVISDLTVFAERNGLPRLAAQLRETALIAALEIAPGRQRTVCVTDGRETGADHRLAACCKIA